MRLLLLLWPRHSRGSDDAVVHVLLLLLLLLAVVLAEGLERRSDASTGVKTAVSEPELLVELVGGAIQGGADLIIVVAAV